MDLLNFPKMLCKQQVQNNSCNWNLLLNLHLNKEKVCGKSKKLQKVQLQTVKSSRLLWLKFILVILFLYLVKVRKILSEYSSHIQELLHLVNRMLSNRRKLWGENALERRSELKLSLLRKSLWKKLMEQVKKWKILPMHLSLKMELFLLLICSNKVCLQFRTSEHKKMWANICRSLKMLSKKVKKKGKDWTQITQLKFQLIMM